MIISVLRLGDGGDGKKSTLVDNIIKEKVFENVPVTRNQVTKYTGSFFGSSGGGETGSGDFRMTADPDWDAVNGYTF